MMCEQCLNITCCEDSVDSQIAKMCEFIWEKFADRYFKMVVSDTLTVRA